MERRAQVFKMIKRTWLVLVHIFLLIGLALFLHSKWYSFKSSPPLPPDYKKELVNSALKSLETKDVPVGALLIYKGKIVGTGYNTVVRNTGAGEHAEINAISNAIDSLGFRQFQFLYRDSLWLISTYEPCMMCAGAMVIYNIQNVSFLKEKTLEHNLRQDARLLRYFWKRTQMQPASLQDSLFYLHPDYPKK